jgi:hypothetical protein
MAVDVVMDKVYHNKAGRIVNAFFYSNSHYVIARAVFPKQSPDFGREAASFLAATFPYRELLALLPLFLFPRK